MCLKIQKYNSNNSIKPKTRTINGKTHIFGGKRFHITFYRGNLKQKRLRTTDLQSVSWIEINKAR